MNASEVDPSLRIAFLPGDRHLRVRRSESVPDGFWLVLRSEWGSSGAQPGVWVDVPVEMFLGHLSWLSGACRRYGVGIEWDAGSRELVLAARRLKEDLARSLAGAVEPENANDRLHGSRYARALRPFQERDLSKLIALAHGANFSVPGAGKTAVQYGIYEGERSAGRVQRMLVVAPLSAFESWYVEAGECFSDPPVVGRFVDQVPAGVEVLLVNYQRLAGYYDVLADWVNAVPTLVVLDEAHRMKRGWAGEWGAACLSLAYLATRRDILSGTPAPQSISDLLALMDFLWPNNARTIVPSDALVSPPPLNAGQQVADRIRPLFARTRKNELGLRPPTYSVLEVPVEGLHKMIYDALRDRYAGTLSLGRADRVSIAQMGQIVMYLLEAASNPALLVAGSSPYDVIEFRHPPLEIPADSRLADLLRDYPRYETPRKFVELGLIVRSNAEQGRKTLVWSNFVRNLETLRSDFAVYEPAVVHGGIPPAFTVGPGVLTREAEVERFRTDPSCLVLLANPAATSEGISLHLECHDAVYLERTFNAGQYLQSVDRIHRLGLAPDVETRITILNSVGTIDDVVTRRVSEKAERLGDMLDDVDIVTMALPDDDDFGPAVDTQEDVAALFSHLRGELGE